MPLRSTHASSRHGENQKKGVSTMPFTYLTIQLGLSASLCFASIFHRPSTVSNRRLQRALPRVRLGFGSFLSMHGHTIIVHHGDAAPPLNRSVRWAMEWRDE